MPWIIQIQPSLGIRDHGVGHIHLAQAKAWREEAFPVPQKGIPRRRGAKQRTLHRSLHVNSTYFDY